MQDIDAEGRQVGPYQSTVQHGGGMEEFGLSQKQSEADGIFGLKFLSALVALAFRLTLFSWATSPASPAPTLPLYNAQLFSHRSYHPRRL